MIPQVRYQVFLSSTYQDLREERQQWELIKRVIEESDYYIIILAGRYGSLGPGGLSYTEMEYDYAVEKGIPVLGFVRDGTGDISFDRQKNRKRVGRNWKFSTRR